MAISSDKLLGNLKTSLTKNLVIVPLAQIKSPITFTFLSLNFIIMSGIQSSYIDCFSLLNSSACCTFISNLTVGSTTVKVGILIQCLNVESSYRSVSCVANHFFHHSKNHLAKTFGNQALIVSSNPQHISLGTEA